MKSVKILMVTGTQGDSSMITMVQMMLGIILIETHFNLTDTMKLIVNGIQRKNSFNNMVQIVSGISSIQ